MTKKCQSANEIFFKRICELDAKIENLEMDIKSQKEKMDDFRIAGKETDYVVCRNVISRLEKQKKEFRNLKTVSQALYFKTGGWQ